MTASKSVAWGTSPDLFATLPGGEDVTRWFGLVPSFHDANLIGLELRRGDATLRIAAFRMTDQVDAAGYFILDRHAVVTIQMTEVTGVDLNGDAQSIIAGLVIRRVEADLPSSRFVSCGGPKAGDYEVTFETSYGLSGSLFARSLSLTVEATQA